MKRKPKYRVGQVVWDDLMQQPYKIYVCYHDFCDGWEYQLQPNVNVFTFEEHLRSLTRREIGPQRKTKGRTGFALRPKS